MLVLKIEASKPPRNDLKNVGVIEMTHMYGAWGSFVILRSKNTVKLPTQSAEKWICMGKWAFEILAKLFLKNQKASDDRTFYPVSTMLPQS